LTQTDAAKTDDEAREALRVGLAYGVGAYGWWAFVFPLHLRWLAAVTPSEVVSEKLPWSLEIVAHRIVWSLLLSLLLVAFLRRGRALRETLRRPRTLLLLAIGAVLVSANWLLFIVAVARAELYRAGIGYFVTPILQIALGVVFLGERLRRGQAAAVALALAGLLVLLVVGGNLPWIELGLALTFGCYGLVRKRVGAVGPIVGLTLETAVLLPLALAWLVVGPAITGAPAGFTSGSVGTVLLLIATGISSGVPLMFFAAAAARLPLSTIGFLQFSAPTGQFLLGVLAFGERPPDPRLWIGYALIWIAVLALVGEGLRARQKGRRRSVG
jgi:chloramphenicol-sensitive protein RarD